MIKGKAVIHIEPQPSWLNNGYKKHLAIFNELFYKEAGDRLKCDVCNLCELPIKQSLW